MKIVIPSDLHFGHSEKHDEDVQRGMDQVAGYCFQHESEIGSILIPGDVFDRPKVSTMTQRRAFDSFSNLPAGLPLRILTGNHDVNAAGDNALEVLQSDLIAKRTRIELFSSPTRIVDLDAQVDWIMVPYLPEYAFPDKLAQFVKDKTGEATADHWQVLVTHADVPGAIYGAEREIKIGQDHSLPSLDSDLAMIVSGHIHKYQEFVHGRIQGFYPGALSRVSITEKDDPKGFVVLETEDLSFEFIQRTDARQYWRFDVKATAKGSVTLPGMKKVQPWDSVQIHVQAPAKARGKVDRAGLQSKAVCLFKGGAPDISVRIAYDSEASKKVAAISKKTGLASYEQMWVEANVSTKTAQNTVLKEIRKRLAEQEQEVAQYRDPLFVQEIVAENYQMIASASIQMEPGQCVGVVAASQGKVSRSNGLGKSTVLEQAPFVFYGDTRYARNASVIRDGADSATATIKLQNSAIIQASKRSDISVYRTITAKSVKAEVTIGGEVKATGAAQTKALMQEFLGLTQKGFDSVLFYAPDSGRRFSIVGASPADRIKVLQDILDLSAYDKAQKALKPELRKLKSDIAAVKASIEHFESYGSASDLKEIEARRDELKSAIKAIDEYFAESEKEIQRLRQMQADVNLFKELDEARSQISRYIPAKEQNARLKELEAELYSLKLEMNDLWKDGEKIKMKIDHNEDHYDNLGESGGRCPTCGSDLESSQFKDRLDELEEENRQLSIRLQSIEKEKTQKTSKQSSLEKQIARMQTELREIDKLESNLAFLQKQAKGKKKPEGTAKEIEKKIARAEAEAEAKASEQDGLSDGLADVEVTFRQMAEAKSKLAQKKSELKKYEKKLETLEMVDQALNWSGIPTFICRQLADNVNEILPDVADDFDFWQKPSVRFEYEESETGNDAIIVEASMEGGPYREFEGLSAGQREIVNFIVRESVRRVLGNLGRCNLQAVWIDEALDKLDRENMERAAKYFREQAIQAFIVSHSYLQDAFEKLVTVESNGKYSRVVA